MVSRDASSLSVGAYSTREVGEAVKSRRGRAVAQSPISVKLETAGGYAVYLRALLTILLLGLIALFAFLNWNVFMTEASLSLGFTTVRVPLASVLVGLTLVFLLYVVYLQSSVLLEGRRRERALQAQREIAENAEASRFYQLKVAVEEALRERNDQSAELRHALFARLEKLERDLQTALEQSSNSLAAYIGEIEDRLERAAGGKK